MQRNRGKTIEWERLEISTRNLRDAKGTFHAKIGSIEDRNDMDLQKQKILRRGGKNTQKNCTKKVFMTQIIMMVEHSPRARHPGM